MRTIKYYAYPALAFALVGSIFAYQFFYQGGRYSSTPDGIRYLAAAQGETVDLPYNSRIVVPLVASLIARLTAVSVGTAFNILTITSLLGSLLLLVYLMERRGVFGLYSAALITAFGAGLAVFHGKYPTLVDMPLLLLTCLTIVALDHGKLFVALAIICIAALTKEYGVLLTLAWAIQAYKQKGAYILAGAILPVAAVMAAVLLSPSRPGVYPSHQSFLISQLKYQAFWLYPEYLFNYLKLAHFWAWGAVWPILMLSVWALIKTLRGGSVFTMDELRYSAMLFATPILLTGDWDRTFVLLVPFACLVPVSSPLARDVRFCFLLGIGGLSTALLRSHYIPHYGEDIPSNLYKLILVLVSVSTSAALVIIWCHAMVKVVRRC